MTRVVAVAAPGLVLAVLGLFHPRAGPVDGHRVVAVARRAAAAVPAAGRGAPPRAWCAGTGGGRCRAGLLLVVAAVPFLHGQIHGRPAGWRWSASAWVWVLAAGGLRPAEQ